MTKKTVIGKFWWINRNFFGKEVIAKIFHRFWNILWNRGNRGMHHCLGGWTPLEIINVAILLHPGLVLALVIGED